MAKMTKKLTYPIKTLIAKAEQLPEQQNYYSGLLLKHDISLPDSILIFRRKGIWPIIREGKIHSRYLLNVNLGTECMMFLDGKNYVLHPGEILLIHPYQNHLFIHNSPGIFRLMVGFESSTATFLPEKKHTMLMNQVVFDCFERLFDEYLNRADSLACSLLLSMILNELKLQTAPSLLPVTGQKAQWLENLFQYIQNHTHHSLSIDHLAKQFNVSASHLRLKFRKSTGISLGAYIIKTKISQAIQLMGKHDMDINQICDQCGYDSVQSFSRAFSREIGMSPNAYRKKHR